MVWSSLEVGAAKETLDVICETVFERSTVIDEISDALVEIASRDVCVGRTSSLERLALLMTKFEDAVEANEKDTDTDSKIDEVAKGSAVVEAIVGPIGRSVVVLSSST